MPGRGGRSLALARVARMCVCFKRASENLESGRIGGKKMGQEWGLVWRAWGWMGRGRERVARESDVIFGYWGANGVGCGQGDAAGGCVGACGVTLAHQYGERKAMALGSEMVKWAGCSRARRYWGHIVI